MIGVLILEDQEIHGSKIMPLRIPEMFISDVYVT